MTPTEIDPAIFRFVAQCLRHRVPWFHEDGYLL
jgi:hypothetical protein